MLNIYNYLDVFYDSSYKNCPNLFGQYFIILLFEALRNSEMFITRVSFVIDHFVYVKMTPIQEVHYAAHNTVIGLVDK